MMKGMALALSGILLVGCVSSSVQERQASVDRLAASAGLTVIDVQTRLPIRVYGRLADGQQPVHVYVEGDGHAWRNARQPSLDPTPHNPVALKLAARDQSANVLYIGRPCQYLNDPARGCQFKIWTEQRFAHVDQLQQAVDQVIDSAQARVLIGFSGGANLAVQLAERMPATQGLITLAGNLDAAAFARFHNLPAEGYGRNAGLLKRLSGLPQLHYSGRLDRVIPPELTLSMLGHGQQGCVEMETVPRAAHTGPWQIDWADFFALQLQCKAGRVY